MSGYFLDDPSVDDLSVDDISVDDPSYVRNIETMHRAYTTYTRGVPTRVQPKQPGLATGTPDHLPVLYPSEDTLDNISRHVQITDSHLMIYLPGYTFQGRYIPDMYDL